MLFCYKDLYKEILIDLDRICYMQYDEELKETLYYFFNSERPMSCKGIYGKRLFKMYKDYKTKKELPSNEN